MRIFVLALFSAFRLVNEASCCTQQIQLKIKPLLLFLFFPLMAMANMGQPWVDDARHPNLIAHIKNKTFEKMVLHNFDNSKEITVDISDGILWEYGRMDTLIVIKNNLFLYYRSNQKRRVVKKVSLASIM